MNGKPTVISTFAGCGGSSLGYKWAGYEELLAIDYDKHVVECFKLNFDCPIWLRDVTKVKAKEILEFRKIKKGDLDVLDGSPPCQGFSTAGKRKVNDLRNKLFESFIYLITELQPKVFVMENVSGMIKGKMKGLFKEIIIALKSLNYQVKCKLLNAKYYEVAQSRRRLIFIGVRNNLNKQPIYPDIVNKKALTIKELISDLLNTKQDKIFNHVWYDDKGKKTKGYLKALNASQGQIFAGRAKRYRWDMSVDTLLSPSGSLEIPGMLRNIGCHPLKTRALSIREYARLQSFPDDFKLINDLCYGYKVIGNSVPPKMMYHIAKTIKESILN